MSNQNYTVQDWMKENTHRKELQKKSLIGDLKVSWNEIREKQWEAFNMALEMQNEVYKRKAQGKTNDWLKREIDKVQSWINDHIEMEQLYLENKAGNSNSIGDAIITGKTYESIKNTYEDYQSGKKAAAIIESKNGSRYSKSRLFQMYVYKDYLSFLKKINGKNQDEREKYNSENFWESAISLYQNDNGLDTYEDVYNHIKEVTGMEPVKKLSTMKTTIPKKIRKRMNKG